MVTELMMNWNTSSCKQFEQLAKGNRKAIGEQNGGRNGEKSVLLVIFFCCCCFCCAVRYTYVILRDRDGSKRQPCSPSKRQMFELFGFCTPFSYSWTISCSSGQIGWTKPPLKYQTINAHTYCAYKSFRRRSGGPVAFSFGIPFLSICFV